MRSRKKGTIIDMLPFGILLLVAGITVVLSMYILQQIKTPFSDAGLNITYVDQGISGLDVFNSGFLLLVFGFGAAAILGAFLIDTHPAFFTVSFLIWVIMILIGTVFTNMFDQFRQQAELSSAIGRFDMLTLVMLNMPLLMVVMGAIVMIVLFSKAGRSG